MKKRGFGKAGGVGGALLAVLLLTISPIWASTALRMVAEDAREERVALGASATVAELVLEDRQGAMAVAGIRAQAFARGAAPSPDAFIETRYALFEAVRLRMGKGATCLTASLPVPPPDGLARAMLLEYRKLGTELASGAIPQEGYEERLSEAVAAWTEWEAAFGGASSYISDLGVHPAFRRLGLAASLCAATLARARDRDFTDVFLHVEETNTAARALYEVFGFARVDDCPAALKLSGAVNPDP
ncbi:acyl-CoA N-acyltransferase [Baffinella frigidus]|nr:acyl-CoA N-acyltransferase [Cryptophyta sp. CCMP2293]